MIFRVSIQGLRTIDCRSSATPCVRALQLSERADARGACTCVVQCWIPAERAVQSAHCKCTWACCVLCVCALLAFIVGVRVLFPHPCHVRACFRGSAKRSALVRRSEPCVSACARRRPDSELVQQFRDAGERTDGRRRRAPVEVADVGG